MVTAAAASYLVTVGNLRVSVLTGRVLFKDVHYYCRDYSFRLEQHTVFYTLSKMSQNDSIFLLSVYVKLGCSAF